MNAALVPLRFVIVAASLWLNRQQQPRVIDHLKEENRPLKTKPGDRRIGFTDAERRHLVIAAKALGRKALFELETLLGFIGKASLRRAIREHQAHYHAERNQGLDNKQHIAASSLRFSPEDHVSRRERLGGMLSLYYRKAA